MFEDLVGKRFGRWLVLEKSSIRLNGFVCYLCLCDCGTTRIVRSIGLKQDSKSCGCLQKERASVVGKKTGPANIKFLHTKKVWNKASESRRIYPEQCANFLSYIKEVYKVSPMDWTHLVLRANGRCEICSKDFRNSREVSIDHNHQTGKIRGLLCTGCNSAIQILDDFQLFTSAKSYLEVYG
jgi:hypothetical protein